MSAPLNKSQGGSLKHAWRMLDRYRAREAITPHQIEFALAAIFNATGRTPLHGSPTYEFEGESEMRAKQSPR